MKNVICILANNLELFKIVTNNLPENINLFVINDTRLGDKINDLKAIYPNATYIRGNDMIDEFDFHPNVRRFALVLKLLIPTYMFKHYDCDKVLLLDDDVIITDKIHELFDTYVNGMSALGMLEKPPIKNDIRHQLILKICELFNVEHIPLLQSSNGGIILFDRDTIDNEYKQAVIDYVSDALMTQALIDARSWSTYQLDEIFFSYFTKRHNYPSMKLAKCVADAYEKIDWEKYGRYIKNKALFHIVNRKHKVDVFKDLVKLNYLK